MSETARKAADYIRFWIQWLEDTAASLDNKVSEGSEDTRCYRVSYAEPKGVIEHGRSLRPNEDWYMGLRLDFADFDLQTIFMNEAGVRYSNDQNKMSDKAFVGNIRKAVEVLRTYEGSEVTFISSDEILSHQEMNRFHYLANSLGYALAQRNNFEVAPVEWSERDSEVLYNIVGAIMFILMYQPLTTSLVFLNTLSSGMRSVLLNYALVASSDDFSLNRETDPGVRVAAQVLISRNQLLEDSFSYLFEGEPTEADA